MKFIVLADNRGAGFCHSEEFSLLIQDSENSYNVLFDTGVGDNFLINAEKLGVDMNTVDSCVIALYKLQSPI